MIFKRDKIQNRKINYISERAFWSAVKTLEAETSKSVCLDIGATAKTDNYITVDRLSGADLRGDILTQFAPGHDDTYPQLADIKKNWYMHIRMSHLIEHIPWIYQELLFQWVYSLMADGGKLSIATPNLEYVMKIYQANRDRQNKGKMVKYPANEHEYLDSTFAVQSDMQRWVNFKIFSGCSPGDTHHCCYDAFWLNDMLSRYFSEVRIVEGSTLLALATKDLGAATSVDDLVREAIQ